MKTLHHPTPNGNPRSVNDRRSHQCARPGWRPPHTSQHQLAQDIADSILEHRELGDIRYIHPHEFTANPIVQAMVLQLLSAATAQQ